ncbi:MAG: nitrous oxide reductase family maturation protein NosD [Chloroflexi bacterium]|nr:nitrous oxide reductase family maturation protein NosD [Chloroflexota bacterium]
MLVVGNDGQYATIEAALAAAQDGDTIEVHGGVYGAPLNIEKSVSLIGVNGPVIDGQGTGTLVLIYAPDVLFQGFVIRNTGSNLSHEDSAIVIQAERVTVAENRLESVLFGIYFAAASHGIARDNVIYGKPEVSEGLRGDSIRVWYSDHVLLSGNQAYITRDVLIWYANFVSIENNIFARNRYGLHVMYSNDMTVTGNTFAESSVGCYLMYALRFTMTDNYVVNNRGPSGYGLALKDMDSVTVSHNVLAGNRAGLYLDNSPALYEGFNEFEFNLLAYNDIGVLALPAVARNIFQNNIFLDNVQQAGTEGRGNLQGNVWQEDGIGNYWSDYVGYDEDGDGIGDLAYRSERLSESLSDSYPVLRLFIYSPALQALDFVGAAFPSLRPDPKLIDEAPLMQYTLPGSSALPGTAPLFWGAALILCISGAAVYVFALRSSWSVRLRRLS